MSGLNAGRVEAELVAVYRGRNEISKFEKDVGKVKRLTEKDIKAHIGVKGNDRGLKQFNDKLQSTHKDASSLRGGLLSATGALSGMGIAGAAAAGAIAGLGVAFVAAKKSIKNVEDLAKSTGQLSTTMRLGVGEASQWAELLRVFGVDSATASVGFARLAKNTEAARKGSKQMADAFRVLGFRQKELRNLKADVIIKRIADSFKSGRNPSQSQLAAASQILGRNFRQLLPILRQGRQGIDDTLTQIRKYGAYLSGKNVKDVGEFRKAQREAKIATDALKISIGTNLIPVLLQLVPKIRQVAEGALQGKGPFKDLHTAISGVWDAVKWAIDHWSEIKKAYKYFSMSPSSGPLNSLNLLVTAINAVSDALRRLNETVDGLGAIPKSIVQGLTQGRYGGRTGGRASKLKSYAGGGRIPGARVAADTFPAMLSPGEFVVTEDGERTLEGMTFPGVLNWLQYNQMPHFASGGRVSTRMNTWTGAKETHTKAGWKSAARKKAADQKLLNSLTIRRLIDNEPNTAAEVDYAVAQYEGGDLGTIEKMLSVWRSMGLTGLPAALANQVSQRLATFKAVRSRLVTAKRLAGTATTGAARAKAAGTLADLYDSATSARSELGSVYSMLASEVGSMDSNPLNIATAFSDFQTARANAFSTFGSNFVGAGGQINTAAGLKYWGAGSMPSSASGTQVRITNHFQQPPSDPHLWSRRVGYELRAVV